MFDVMASGVRVTSENEMRNKLHIFSFESIQRKEASAADSVGQTRTMKQYSEETDPVM